MSWCGIVEPAEEAAALEAPADAGVERLGLEVCDDAQPESDTMPAAARTSALGPIRLMCLNAPSGCAARTPVGPANHRPVTELAGRRLTRRPRAGRPAAPG